MNLSKIRSKVKSLKKVNQQLKDLDYSFLIGVKVKLSKKFRDWSNAHKDEVGYDDEDLKFINDRKAVGIIKTVEWDNEFNDLVLRVHFKEDKIVLGAEDVEEVS